MVPPLHPPASPPSSALSRPRCRLLLLPTPPSGPPGSALSVFSASSPSSPTPALGSSRLRSLPSSPVLGAGSSSSPRRPRVLPAPLSPVLGAGSSPPTPPSAPHTPPRHPNPPLTTRGAQQRERRFRHHPERGRGAGPRLRRRTQKLPPEPLAGTAWARDYISHNPVRSLCGRLVAGLFRLWALAAWILVSLPLAFVKSLEKNSGNSDSPEWDSRTVTISMTFAAMFSRQNVIIFWNKVPTTIVGNRGCDFPVLDQWTLTHSDAQLGCLASTPIFPSAAPLALKVHLKGWAFRVVPTELLASLSATSDPLRGF
ncbi:hypothetical protein J0S82_001751 [Galemys pyrenaicus]|uniref:Uncharacterized protein n=1 Tax=Galemys pyrenaicus TaxID=202257 RepID=A0A8J5ZWE8_GALPY|nr:hypothetical protein J0S82_001751 [Galemys pyrenaicus]